MSAIGNANDRPQPRRERPRASQQDGDRQTQHRQDEHDESHQRPAQCRQPDVRKSLTGRDLSIYSPAEAAPTEKARSNTSSRISSHEDPCRKASSRDTATV